MKSENVRLNCRQAVQRLVVDDTGSCDSFSLWHDESAISTETRYRVSVYQCIPCRQEMLWIILCSPEGPLLDCDDMFEHEKCVEQSTHLDE